MRTKALQLLILLSLVSQTPADSVLPKETNPTPGFGLASKLQLASEYEAFFRQHVSKEHFLGAAFVVVSGDQIIHLVTTGHTDTSREQAINENTIFRVASVSKTFAAGLTGVLVTEGQFSWDDPVNQYVPEFRINGDTQKVRIRHLLGQSTGLIPHAYDNLIEDGVSLDKIQDQYRKLSYICTPGQCYSYQNSVFSLIEPVIEEATTKSYAALNKKGHMENRAGFAQLLSHSAGSRCERQCAGHGQVADGPVGQPPGCIQTRSGRYPHPPPRENMAGKTPALLERDDYRCPLRTGLAHLSTG